MAATKREKKQEVTENAGVSFLGPSASDWKEIQTQNVKREDGEASLTNDFLVSSLQIKNLVVLAGSGTSLGNPKGPSMSDLWDCIMKKSDAADRSQTETPGENVAKKLNVTLDGLSGDIESFLSKCEAYLQFNDKDDEVKAFLKDSKKIILDKCRNFIGNERLTAHETFLLHLSRRRTRDPRLQIFTTNYDLCFETAAGKQGLIVIDGFSFSQPRTYDPKYFSVDIVRHKDVQDEKMEFMEGVFRLFKLHGSVNWARKNGKIIQDSNVDEDSSCIIYPAKGKYQQSYFQPHLEQISKFFEALRTPNTCLMVVGFGFADDHLSEPILSAIESNPNLRLLIVDLKAKETLGKQGGNVDNYWNKFNIRRQNGWDIFFINASFEEFSNLISGFKHPTTNEQLVKKFSQVIQTEIGGSK